MNYPHTAMGGTTDPGSAGFTTLGRLPATEPRVNQVEEQLKMFSALASDLENIVTLLSNRISSVTRPSENKKDPQATPRPVLVPLAEQLQAIGDSFAQQINVLRELNGAIELP